MTAVRRLGAYVLLAVAAIAAWQVVVISEAVSPVVLPTIPSVGTALQSLLEEPRRLVEPVLITLREAGAAFAIATVLGAITGLLLGMSRLFTRAFEPMLAAVTAVPLVVLYPVFAATLGLGSESKIAIGALYGYFPVAIATTRAAAQVDPTLVSAFRAMGGHRLGTLRLVILPAVLQPLFAAFRVALGLCLVTVIAGQFIAGAEGLGYELAATSQSLDTPGLFAWVLVAIVLTILVNAIFTLVTQALQRGLER